MTPTSATPAEPTDEVAADAVPTTPEATPDEPPATTPQGRGSLHVATPGGWALVYRGRQRLGETPGTFTLPAGPQDVGIQPFGEGPIRRRRVVVPAGGIARLSLPIR
jgi:serine/threonine-protein kinase